MLKLERKGFSFDPKSRRVVEGALASENSFGPEVLRCYLSEGSESRLEKLIEYGAFFWHRAQLEVCLKCDERKTCA